MPIPTEDVTRLLGALKPGTTYTASYLYRRYAQSMASDGREPEHPVSLGQALRDHGCVKTRIRRRVAGVQKEEAGWTLPSDTPGAVEIDPVAEMVKSFGESGIYPEDEIWARYARLCGQNRHTPLSRSRLMLALTRAGHPHLTDKRRSCRWLNVPES